MTVPPQNLEAEEAVLGAMMITAEAIDVASDTLTAGDFYKHSHGALFKAALDLHSRGEAVDTLTLGEKTGQKELVSSLGMIVPTSANVGHYAAIVKDCAERRAFQKASVTIHGWATEGVEGLSDKAEQLVYELAQQRPEGDLDPQMHSYLETLTRLRENEQELIGVPSGYTALDRLTQGFIPGNLIVVAARPSMGKSSLAFNIALRLVGNSIPVAMWTMEMSKPEISQRLLSIAAQVPGEHVKNPRKASPEEWGRIVESAGKLEQSPLYVAEAGSFTPLEIRSQLRRLMARVPVGLAIVDYLGLMNVEAENRTQEVSKITQMLKATAKDLGVPLMVLSQLNRNLEQRTDKRPILSDLRESGSVEQDADLVIFLYRDDYYNENSSEKGWVELNLAKHRNGPTDRVRLVWKREFAQFSNPQLGLVDTARAA